VVVHALFDPPTQSENMKYGFYFLAVGVAMTWQALIHRGWCWLLLWPASSFSVVASAYIAIGPRIIGKKSNGTLAWYSIIVLLPYLLFTWISWHILRLINNERPCNEVSPNLIIGRRLHANDLPGEINLVIDLTSEFIEPRGVRTGRAYFCVPMLDGAVPSEADLVRAMTAANESQGPVYIHCAQGHGRSGLVAAAVLLSQGRSANADDAIRSLKAARPKVHLNKRQMQFLRMMCQGLIDRSGKSPGKETGDHVRI
jgi:protein-tyrosine phosphatase